MKESRLCPFRRIIQTHFVPREYVKDPDMVPAAYDAESFMPCIEDRCAMWRAALSPSTARNAIHTDGGLDYDIDCVGWCGLVGK
jgi:hypothetical protein